MVVTRGAALPDDTYLSRGVLLHLWLWNNQSVYYGYDEWISHMVNETVGSKTGRDPLAPLESLMVWHSLPGGNGNLSVVEREEPELFVRVQFVYKWCTGKRPNVVRLQR